MMQIIDATTELDQSVEVNCDICIVGAGLAGIFLGSKLVGFGQRVCIIEAGGKKSLDEQKIGIQTHQSGMQYKGATVGRSFGLGGTGTQWGGVLAPYTLSDIRESVTQKFDVWKHIVNIVNIHGSDVLSSIGFDKVSPSGQYFEKVTLGDNASPALVECLDLVSAEILPFRSRSFLNLLNASRKLSGELFVYLRTMLTSMEMRKTLNGDSVITAACCQAGIHEVKILANSFVLCAGAIETTRLLLELERANKATGYTLGNGLGKYLGDHISSAIAEIPAEQWTYAAKKVGPVFLGSKMRSFRLVERRSPANVPRYFTHFIFNQENAGFNLAKKILSGVQSRSIPEVSFQDLTRGIFGLSNLAFDRVVHSRLHIPKSTPVHLQLDIEQAPSPQNRIYLCSEKDAFGRPIAVIDWAIRDRDYESIEQTSQRIFTLWPKSEITLPRLRPLKNGIMENIHDAYHPVGTCRMGTDLDAVVGPDLRVHGVANLYVLSTAIFPTAGSANPTYSMLCFGSALANSIS